MSERDPLLAILRGLHDAVAHLANTTRWECERARAVLADVDRILREHEQIRDAGCRAPAGATASEGDDSRIGQALTEPERESSVVTASGPEVTSSQGAKVAAVSELTCRCPMCRRFPRTMRRISEFEAKPLSAQSRAILRQLVRAEGQLQARRDRGTRKGDAGSCQIHEPGSPAELRRQRGESRYLGRARWATLLLLAGCSMSNYEVIRETKKWAAEYVHEMNEELRNSHFSPVTQQGEQ